MGPFEAVWQWYEYARDSMDFAASEAASTAREIPPSLALARHATAEEAFENLAKAQSDLDDLTVLALFAIFEQALLDHLLQTSQRVQQGIASRLQGALADKAFRGLDRWPLGEILDVYKVAIDPTLVGLVKQVKDYRDWVAHGKRDAPAARIGPKAAHERLDSFLSALP